MQCIVLLARFQGIARISGANVRGKRMLRGGLLARDEPSRVAFGRSLALDCVVDFDHFGLAWVNPQLREDWHETLAEGVELLL